MNATKFYVIFQTILRIVMTICITIAACYFGKWGLLFFYFVPALMSLNVTSTPDNKDNNQDIDVFEETDNK